MEKVNVLLAHELAVLELEDKIQNDVQQEVDKAQREYLLREQLRAIQRELGEVALFTRDVNDLRTKIRDLALPAAIREKVDDEVNRLGSLPNASPEVGIIRTYLDCLLGLPWHEATEDDLDLERASVVLDANHYGLPKVKERILEFIAVRKLAGRQRALADSLLCGSAWRRQDDLFDRPGDRSALRAGQPWRHSRRS